MWTVPERFIFSIKEEEEGGRGGGGGESCLVLRESWMLPSTCHVQGGRVWVGRKGRARRRSVCVCVCGGDRNIDI